MRLSLLIFLMLLVAVPSSGLSRWAVGQQQQETATAEQEKVRESLQQVLDKVRQRSQVVEQGWKRVHEMATYDATAYADWKQGKAYVHYHIGYFDSLEKADERYRVGWLVYPIGPEKTEPTKNLGDVGSKWTFTGGRSVLHFRHKNLVVIVQASSADLAEQFARHIAASL